MIKTPRRGQEADADVRESSRYQNKIAPAAILAALTLALWVTHQGGRSLQTKRSSGGISGLDEGMFDHRLCPSSDPKSQTTPRREGEKVPVAPRVGGEREDNGHVRRIHPSSNHHEEKKTSSNGLLPKGCSTVPPKEWSGAGCFDDAKWFTPWVQSRIAEKRRLGQKWHFVNVGANKGYNVADWIEEMLSDSEHNHGPNRLPPAMDEYVQRKKLRLCKLVPVCKGTNKFKSLCGACCDCLRARTPTTNFSSAGPPHDEWKISPKELQIDAFEPSVRNAEWLSHFFKPLIQENVVKIHQLAISNFTGKSKFRQPGGDTLGSEVGRISGHSKATSSMKTVYVDQLDKIYFSKARDSGAQEEDSSEGKGRKGGGGGGGGPFIDFMETDTEGNDQFALLGARRLLEEGRIGVIKFELAAATSFFDWKPHIYDWLERIGYTCWWLTRQSYFATQLNSTSTTPNGTILTKTEVAFPAPRAVKITHGCWQDGYETVAGTWANAHCYHKREASILDPIFTALSQQTDTSPFVDDGVCGMPTYNIKLAATKAYGYEILKGFKQPLPGKD